FALKNVSKVQLPLRQIIGFYSGNDSAEGKSLKALAELVQKAEAIPVGDVKLTKRECYFQEKVFQKAQALLEGLDEPELKEKINTDISYICSVFLDTNAIGENQWSRSAAWFRESPCRDYKSLWYWFGVKESCIKWLPLCLGQYPGEILSLSEMEEINYIFKECSEDGLRDLKLRQLLAKDPIRFEILNSLAEVFQKILQKSSGEWRITAIPLASVFGLSEPFVRDLTAKSSRCIAAELKKVRDEIKERSDQWYGNLGAILSSRAIFADRPSAITLVDLNIEEQDIELGTGSTKQNMGESFISKKTQVPELLNSCMVVDVQDIYMNTAFWMGI
ncbi:hypothetical protein BC833DRAFT_612628, partial [Globomyces pollinis-pini]